MLNLSWCPNSKVSGVKQKQGSEEGGDEVAGQRVETEDWEMGAATPPRLLPGGTCRVVFAPLCPFHRIAIPHQGKSRDSKGASMQPF